MATAASPYGGSGADLGNPAMNDVNRCDSSPLSYWNPGCDANAPSYARNNADNWPWGSPAFAAVGYLVLFTVVALFAAFFAFRTADGVTKTRAEGQTKVTMVELDARTAAIGTTAIETGTKEEKKDGMSTALANECCDALRDARGSSRLDIATVKSRDEARVAAGRV